MEGSISLHEKVEVPSISHGRVESPRRRGKQVHLRPEDVELPRITTRSRPSIFLLLIVPLLLVISDAFDLPPATQLRALEASFWRAQQPSCRGEVPRIGGSGGVGTHTSCASKEAKNGTVAWDKYSLIINDERVLLWGGEFHTWRLPVVELWRDVLQKFKSAGLNSVSIYIHWGLVNPAPGVFDFEGHRALEPLFEIARDVGLWVVVRPGPYINAETSGGGIPGWVTLLDGRLRTNDTSFTEAWKPYISRVAEIVAPYQVTRTAGGVGPVIAVQVDNEFNDDGGERTEYMRLVKEELRKGGIDVPLTFNDAERFGNFVKGPASVDIYGFDSYPLGFDCSHPDKWDPLREGYRTYHEATNPDQPLYIPEYQGGAFDPWGGPGYDSCRELTGLEFTEVFNNHLLSENVKMANFYMTYGGTNWGTLAFPGVYTSYDYGSAVSENRGLTDKFFELKSQGLFLESSPDFAKTDFVGNSSTANYTDNPNVWAVQLKNPDTGSRWLILRHKDSTSNGTAKFQLSPEFPRFSSHYHLRGRDSLILSFNARLGAASKLASSNAQVFWSGTVGDRDTVILRSHPDDAVEATVLTPHENNLRTVGSSSPSESLRTEFFKGGVKILAGAVKFSKDSKPRVLTSDGLLVILSTDRGSDQLWPVSARSAARPTNIIVEGADLVRSANISECRRVVSIEGDIRIPTKWSSEDRAVTVYGPATVSYVVWNNRQLPTTVSEPGILTFVVPSPSSALSVPNLLGWRYFDSLPEIATDADSKTLGFIPADKRETHNPYKPHEGHQVLYACEYGFCEGTTIWQANITGEEMRGIDLTLAGGNAFAASAWLDGHFLNSTDAAQTLTNAEVNVSWKFPYEGTNSLNRTLTVLLDNSGMEETGPGYAPEFTKSPRGIRGYRINGDANVTWAVVGRAGGFSSFPDKQRGVLHEGGLYAERIGLQSPSLDDSDWEYRDIATGIKNDMPGVGIFRTSFELHVEDEVDAMFSINILPGKGRYRAYIYVNGWQMGKFVSDYGPQHKFPVHRGILHHVGTNSLAIIVWSLEAGSAPGGVYLALDDVYYRG